MAWRQIDIHPLEAVVQLLGEVEKGLASGKDVPLGFESKPALERDERRKQLGHTAPAGRRIDMEHSGTPERGGQLLDFADRLLTDQARVGLYGSVSKIDPSHRFPRCFAAGRGAPTRAGVCK